MKIKEVAPTRGAPVCDELVAALTEMVEVYWIGSEDDPDDPPDCIKRAQAALAKARA